MFQSANMIGSFASHATASLVAKNGTKKLFQPFEELQGSKGLATLTTYVKLRKSYQKPILPVTLGS